MNLNGIEVPQNIIDAAETLRIWCAENGFERWELLGVCDRRFAEEARASDNALKVISEHLARWEKRKP